MADEYDYVIVGAGAAGCVLAFRLSQDPRNKVLLIEAGPSSRNFFIPIPMGMGQVLSSPRHMWYYATEPEDATNRRALSWPRGRLVGGSSAVNGMLYCRGHPQDYEDWATLGCEGWGWPAISAAFRTIEDHQLGEGQGRGVGGPVHISVGDYRSPLSEALLVAASDLGLPVREDVNGPDQEGFGYAQSTIRRGRRESAAQCFLRPARKRPNLRVIPDMLVERVLFEGHRAVGVACRGASGATAFRGGEIILSAGTIETPKLLQLSGIGPASHLAGLGVPVVADNPHVGAHLLEHKQLNQEYQLTQPHSHNVSLAGTRLAANAVRYQMFRTGPLARGIDMAGFLRTRPGLDRPDAQFFVWFLTMRRDLPRMALERAPAAWATAFVLRPKSEGSVMIRSPLPEDAPVIRTNFLSNGEDCDTLLGSFKFLRRLFGCDAVAPFVAHETRPGPAVRTDVQIMDAIRQDDNQAHAAGTCRMGRAGESAVDPQLRVRGVDRLRVVDLSIAPTHLSGNPYGPTMAMAWHAANLILVGTNTKV